MSCIERKKGSSCWVLLCQNKSALEGNQCVILGEELLSKHSQLGSLCGNPSIRSVPASEKWLSLYSRISKLGTKKNGVYRVHPPLPYASKFKVKKKDCDVCWLILCQDKTTCSGRIYPTTMIHLKKQMEAVWWSAVLRRANMAPICW